MTKTEAAIYGAAFALAHARGLPGKLAASHAAKAVQKLRKCGDDVERIEGEGSEAHVLWREAIGDDG